MPAWDIVTTQQAAKSIYSGVAKSQAATLTDTLHDLGSGKPFADFTTFFRQRLEILQEKLLFHRNLFEHFILKSNRFFFLPRQPIPFACTERMDRLSIQLVIIDKMPAVYLTIYLHTQKTPTAGRIG